MPGFRLVCLGVFRQTLSDSASRIYTTKSFKIIIHWLAPTEDSLELPNIRLSFSCAHHPNGWGIQSAVSPVAPPEDPQCQRATLGLQLQLHWWHQHLLSGILSPWPLLALLLGLIPFHSEVFPSESLSNWWSCLINPISNSGLYYLCTACLVALS